MLLKNFTSLTLTLGLLLSSSSIVEANQFDCCAPQECEQIYNPSGWNHCSNSCGFTDNTRLRVDFLWWRATEDGLELGTLDTVSSNDFETLTINDSARTKKPNFRYDPGVRVGITKICDCWDFTFNWTNFHTKADVKVLANSVAFAAQEAKFGNANSTFFNSDWFIAPPNPLESFGRWTLDMDLFDLEAGYKFAVSSCLKVRPTIGLRIARVNQGYRIFSAASFGTSEVITSNTEIKAKNDFLGAGPKIGFDFELNIGCGLALFGEAAGTLAFGTFHNHSRANMELDEFSTDSGTINDATIDYRTGNSSSRCSRAITDVAFGLKWEHCFCWCNRMHPVSVLAAWEHHGFFKFNQFRFDPSVASLSQKTRQIGVGVNYEKRGDLFTQGLTLALQVGF